MPQSPDDFLAELARRAEGLQRPALPREQRQDEPAAARARWRRWLRFGGGYDWRVLRRRLRAEGLYPCALYQRAAPPPTLPGWCDTLARIRAAAMDGNAAVPAHCADLPLADALAPCLHVARASLAAAGPAPDPAHFLPGAAAGLERTLMQRLAHIAGPCLLKAFDAHRPAPPLAALLPDAGGTAPRAHYPAFVAATLAEGYRSVLERWPVLGRLLAIAVEHWVGACRELHERLARDQQALHRKLFPGAPASPVARVHDTGSDTHGGGRTVLRLDFAHGGVAVYKPRPVDAEAALGASLDWLNGQLAADGALTLRVPRILAREGYGWMEWVETAAMPAGAEGAYHWRLGCLLGLYRALNGTDLHHENLVAAGECPVIVDGECLLHPRALPLLAGQEAAADEDAHDAFHALLGTGALPCYSGSADGTITNLAAIGRAPAAQGMPEPTFFHAGTDWMLLRQAPAAPVQNHHPRTAVGWVDSLAHGEAIAEGYHAALSRLLAARGWLLGDARSPWERLRRAQCRHLTRNTWNYGLLLRAAVAPEALTDGVMFDLTFEPLYRWLGEAGEPLHALAASERAALRELDVPRFGYAAEQTWVRDAHGNAVTRLYREAPWLTLRHSLSALDADRLAAETALLRAVLRPSPAPRVDGAHAAGRLGAAAATLAGAQLRLADGRGPWLTLQQQNGNVRMMPTQPGLYAGSAGIGLALAAAAHVLDDASLAGHAHAALDQPRAALARAVASADASGPLAGVGMGYDGGAAGMLFALAHGARLLCDEPLAEKARRLTLDWAGAPAFAANLRRQPGLDLLNGSAGVLLTLLALAGPRDAALRAAARHCGEHLLARGLREGDALSWAPPGRGVGLSGLSHGGAGFAVALAALYRATGHRPYREAAFAALAHEARLYHPGRRNWRDMRNALGREPAQVEACGCSWCHGGPGIALGRAALLRLLDGELAADEAHRLRADLDLGLAACEQVLDADHPAPPHDLCCGLAGVIDIVLECARLLERSELAARARQAAERHLDRWHAEPGTGPRYWFHSDVMTGTDASLFKGQAGWVYLQARLAQPQAVPCVLLPIPMSTS